jgi:hypothetical protein
MVMLRTCLTVSTLTCIVLTHGCDQEQPTSGGDSVAPAGKSDSADEGAIYFEESGQPWQRCYTGSTEKTVEKLWAGQFPGASSYAIANVELLEDGVIRVRYVTSLHQEKEMLLSACLFTEEDRTTEVSCELYVDSKRLASIPLDFYIDIEKAWGVRLIDCQRGVAQRVINGWRQSISLMNIKIMEYLAREGRDLRPKMTHAILGYGDSLVPYQNWSARAALDFMRSTWTPEVTDASVEELSVPANLDDWMQSAHGPTWTPWGLVVHSLRCDGRDAIEATVGPEIQLDMTDPKIEEYCANNP